MRRRLDDELVRRGLVPSRQQARSVVTDGRVLVSGSVATKPARLVAASEPVVVEGPPARFVSRGGDKLDAALTRFGIDVCAARALDVGASTGGFTDCLLQRGAATVLALDVGHGQLHPRLRADPRVVVHERTNLRHVRAPLAGAGGEPYGPAQVVTADLSFISLVTVVPVLTGPVAARGADLVLLVKPQFEAGRAEIARSKGVVRDPAVWRRSVLRVASALESHRAGIMGVMTSPLTGAAGNTELFVHAVAGAPCSGAAALDRRVDAAIAELGA